MEITFQKITLEDKPLLDQYLQYNESRSCEQTFANLYLWSREYPMEYAIFNDCLIYRSANRRPACYCFPLGKQGLKEAVEKIRSLCLEEREPFQMACVTPEQFALLEQWFPGELVISYDRDMADYVYEGEKLRTLAGKKLHSKRNHINRFLKDYEGRWSYEAIGEDNLEECFQMGEVWRRENGCDDDEEKNAEMCVALNALRLIRELDLSGGLLRVDGKVVAFSIGEPVTKDTYVVHIEKAFGEVPGAYPMINQQFALHQAAGYRYINREDDSGQEGLRMAKLSYKPAFLVEKGFVTEKR